MTINKVVICIFVIGLLSSWYVHEKWYYQGYYQRITTYQLTPKHMDEHEQIEIKISYVKNGYVIKRIKWTSLVCADSEEIWVAHEASQVRDIVYDLLPKG